MIEENKLFYKFLAWTFGITVLISMGINFWQIVYHFGHRGIGALLGITIFFILTGIALMLISLGLTQICVFSIWFFRTLVARNINWVKKEFGLSPTGEKTK